MTHHPTPFPHGHRLLLFALALLLPALTGCSFFRPTLRVAWCTTVPQPNGFIESYPWAKAPALSVNAHRGRGEFAESRTIQVKACFDGRALSILVRWVDGHESLIGRYWIWNEKRSTYDLQQFSIDQCAILWPLSKRASFNPWDGKPALYDAWHWRAGWSDLSGYADDRRLIVRPHPRGTTPGTLKGQLYPLGKRRGMVELEWQDDAGKPGTLATPRPITFLKHHVSGAELADTPQGSVADVRAQGVYTPKLRSNPEQQGSWRYHPQGDDWFVEYYRLLVSGSKAEDDCQLRGRKSVVFAIAIWDDASGDNFFLSDPIRLVFDRTAR